MPSTVPTAPAVTQSPAARCGRPAVDPTVELNIESHVLDGAHTTTSTIAFDGRLHVAGWLLDSAGGSAAIWRSNDGTSWERFELEPVGTAHVFDLLATDTGLLAVGGNVGTSFLGEAGIWSSRDGVSWEQLDAPAFELGDQHGAAFRIAEGGPGYIVVGSQHTRSDVNVAVWLSSDGVTWEVVPPADEFESGFPTAMLVREDGTIVVALRICNENGCANGAVITSRDGRTWERHRTSRGPAESVTPVLLGLAEASPSAVFGAGTSVEAGPLVEVDDVASGIWRSADAGTWELAAEFDRAQAMTMADGRLFASGSWGAECEQQNLAVWTSTNGRDWQPAWVSDAGGTIERMSSWDGRLVMIGSVADFEAREFRSTVWVEAR